MAQVEPSPESSSPPLPATDLGRGFQVVVMSGEYDLSRIDALSVLLGRAAGAGGDLVVDASEVTFLDASTIGIIVGTQNTLRQRSRALRVRAPSACVRRILETCDLASLLEAAPTRSRP